MSNNAIASLENITKIYSRGTEQIRAVDEVDITIDSGEFIAVTGPSGSGKTTLMNIIGCIDNPSAGRVIIKNNDISSATEKELTEIRRHSIGFIFQQFFLIPTLTASENVELPALFSGQNEKAERADELLNMVGLGSRKDHLPSQLSGGEMQRVAIARALINSPDILLADEPTGNLDSKNAEKIYDIFNMMNKNGQTIIVVTHNIDLAKHSKRIVLLKDGKINPS